MRKFVKTIPAKVFLCTIFLFGLFFLPEAVDAGIDLPGDTIISTDTTWTPDNTYEINGVVTVQPGVTLTIEDDVRVSCSETGKLVIDGGSLYAVGMGHTWSNLDLIEFACLGEQWLGIEVKNGGYAKLQNIRVSGGPIVVTTNARLYLEDSVIANNGTGVCLNHAFGTLINNIFECLVGIETTESDPDISGNFFSVNGFGGGITNHTGTIFVRAQGNYWGGTALSTPPMTYLRAAFTTPTAKAAP